VAWARRTESVRAVDVIAERFSLTRRQHDVAKEAAFGLTTDEIAKVLGISRHTVKAHLEAVYKSTGCANRHELYRLIYVVIA
jgi:DNA-binding CsgD family transcriptional regulator